MRTALILYLLVYAFMAGTIYSSGDAWRTCPKLEDTNFYTYLTEYGR